MPPLAPAAPAPASTDPGGARHSDAAPGPTISLPTPCELPAPDQNSAVLTSALPMLAGLGSMVMMAGMSGVGQARTFVAGGFFLLSTALLIGTQVARQRRQHRRRVDDARASFLLELDSARRQISSAVAAWRLAREAEHPSLEAWLASPRPGRDDDGRVRIGTATLPTGHGLLAPPPRDPERADPFAVRALESVTARGVRSRDVPLALDLSEWDELVLTTAEGADCSPDDVRRRARHVVCQAAVTRSADALRVVLACSPEALNHWEWLKWLPHHRSLTERDASAGRRLLVADGSAARDDGDQRATLLVVEGDAEVPPALLTRRGTTLLRLPAPGDGCRPVPGRAVLGVDTTGPDALRTVTDTTPCRLEGCPTALAEVVARRLDRDSDGPATSPRAALDDLPALLGIDDLDGWEGPSWWADGSPADALRVPIGVAADGRVLHLDLKESAHGGDGPHGLVVGATGSGKSELLRTLVLALALQHAPEDLGMVLVDFKGGATFAGLGELPHVAAVVTNLGDDLGLVDRMADTLTGELVRRQELLRSTGHASVAEHREARRAGADLTPLPSLFVCIDEFSELLSARPDFIDVFVAIGRVGRSLGVHLLLASQRLEEGRLRGLETHLSYRIGLRTFSAAESRAAIGRPDAHTLPPVPGAGYLATAGGDPVRFTAAYVSGPPPRPAPTSPAGRRPLPWTLLPIPDPPSRRDVGPTVVTTEESGGSTVDRVVARARHLPRTRPVWLPPLRTPASLGSLLADVTHTADLGVHSPGWRTASGRVVPIGLVDRPREARRDLWTLTLSGATGHCAVVGGPHSGRTTALQTLVSALALTATPTEVQFLLVDHGGGGLAPLAGLPHVVASAARGEPLLARVVGEATDLVDRREAYFRDHDIDSFETYLARRGDGRADDGYGEVFVVVDGWGVLRSDDFETEAALHRLAERGLPFGVHLVVATQRWSDLRPSLRDQFGSWVELRLGDPMDSVVDRRRAAGVPRRPGHGLVEDGHALLTAVPALTVPPGAPPPPDPLTHLVSTVDRGWQGVRPRRLARLPERVELADLRQAPDAEAGILLGHDGQEPLVLERDLHSHLLVRGGPGSGRSSVLRTYLQEVQRLHHPSAMQVVVVDPRGGLHGAVDDSHLLHHLVSRAQMHTRIEELATYLRGRLPGPDVTPTELRSRSWWHGAEVTVVVDDHDLAVAGGWQDCGLHLLAPLVPQAREVGLHVVLAQRGAAGLAARASDPLTQALCDLEATTLDLAATGAPGASSRPGRAVMTRRGRPPHSFQVARPVSGVRT